MDFLRIDRDNEPFGTISLSPRRRCLIAFSKNFTANPVCDMQARPPVPVESSDECGLFRNGARVGGGAAQVVGQSVFGTHVEIVEMDVLSALRAEAEEPTLARRWL